MGKGFATIKIPRINKKHRIVSTYKPNKVHTEETKIIHNKAKRKLNFNFIKQRLAKLKFPIMPYIKNNKLILFFLFCMLLGIILGSMFLSYNNEHLTENLSFLFNSNFDARVSQPQLTTFISSITSSFIFILSVMLMGMSIWGVFLIPFVPFFRGMGIGISSGFLFSAYSFKGLLFNLVVVLPGLLVSCVALLIASREACYFSSALLKTQVKKSKVPLVKSYLTQNLKVFILIVISALMDVFFSWCFSGVFVFN